MTKKRYNLVERLKIAKDYVRYHLNPTTVLNAYFEDETITVVVKKYGMIKKTWLTVGMDGVVKEEKEEVYFRLSDLE